MFLGSDDNVDVKVAEEGLEKEDDGGVDEDEDEEEEEIIPEPKPEDPEFKWKIAKQQKKLESASMDQLMALTGTVGIN